MLINKVLETAWIYVLLFLLGGIAELLLGWMLHLLSEMVLFIWVTDCSEWAIVILSQDAIIEHILYNPFDIT